MSRLGPLPEILIRLNSSNGTINIYRDSIHAVRPTIEELAQEYSSAGPKAQQSRWMELLSLLRPPRPILRLLTNAGIDIRGRFVPLVSLNSITSLNARTTYRSRARNRQEPETISL